MSTETKVGHTPGPWRFSWRPGDEINPGSVCSIGGRNHPNRPYAVAMCPRYRGPDSRDSWEADARLIAAAPDLLEALKDLRGLVRDTLIPLINECPGQASMPAAMVEAVVYEQVEAAIAKAEGG